MTKLLPQLATLLNLAFFLVAPVIALLFVGLWVDTTLHSSPVFLIVGVIAGFISGIISVFRITNLFNKPE